VTIGTTDDGGNLSYTFNDNGTHTLSASKEGYIGVSRDIDVRAPFSDFKAQDINVTPSIISIGDNFVIRSNITNVGTKVDTRSIDLIINSTAVSNVSITLGPKETKEINFTQRMSLPEGNYTVEILEQKELIDVKKKPTSILSITAVIATIIGAIAIYIGTTKKGRDTIGKLMKK
jgi:hypothetical protein